MKGNPAGRMPDKTGIAASTRPGSTRRPPEGQRPTSMIACVCDSYGPAACPVCGADWQKRREPMTYPMPFAGTEQEALANYHTHRWGPGADCRCWNCDCRPGHVAASYPCGTEPPRVQAGERRLLMASYSLIDSMAECDESEPGGLL